MTKFDRVVADIKAFVKERDWSQFHDPKNLAMAVVSEAGELASVMRWVPNTEADEFASDQENRQAVLDEVADIAITTLMLCDRLGVDLLEIVEKKMEKNRKNYPVSLSKGKFERPPRKVEEK